MSTPANRRHEVYVGVGSNLGRRIQYLDFAVKELAKLGVCRCSSVYETKPVGYTEQPDFLNMVVQLRTVLSARELLTALQDIEARANRVREIRFGPRTLDLDVLLYDNDYICFGDFQVPHPRMWSRAFVLVPLAELAPSRRGLGGERMATLAALHRQKDEVHHVGRFW
ncbi:2-amino-4-hydroxy-6-hydroxymethyldihydropteridine diphosphokinase [Alicyclobacillus acidoterrestris]|uniref:2-amino-4-hydroxy-6- hydroxymethyldihydropteridine diphosphokinase n=1 Tax=Alicyclobacillus suci TaxID=2816080 RepID=UPI0011930A7C|nr:2-amino-4-hydroxy-6-hydroxymethyldihydropteridine diphosphokinase [Alicyclobacillus suci]GEO26320.1 2-amino-4-hydroxy-6-hydroxymethyldihydropteridine diphosphokinase [Alicyclobacillus acidoterrestris]